MEDTFKVRIWYGPRLKHIEQHTISRRMIEGIFNIINLPKRYNVFVNDDYIVISCYSIDNKMPIITQHTLSSIESIDIKIGNEYGDNQLIIEFFRSSISMPIKSMKH